MKPKFEEQMLEPAIIYSLSYVKNYVYHERINNSHSNLNLSDNLLDVLVIKSNNKA